MKLIRHGFPYLLFLFTTGSLLPIDQVTITQSTSQQSRSQAQNEKTMLYQANLGLAADLLPHDDEETEWISIFKPSEKEFEENPSKRKRRTRKARRLRDFQGRTPIPSAIKFALT